jgi:DNA-binding HxlR family transcriptional regulator
MQSQIFQEFERINRKWAFRILFTVSESGRVGFNGIKRSLRPITSKTLSARLKMLEGMALLTKETIVDRPIKVEYRLTKRGAGIISALARSLKE